jgi:DnaJ-class molecular chaperone
MTPSQSCKKCHGTGKVKDRSSGKRMRCTSCAGTGMIVTAAAKA